VEAFAKNSELRRKARQALRAAPDIARALGRLSVARGGPRDLANLRDGVKAARGLRDSLKKESLGGEALSAIEALAQNIAAVSRLSDRLEFLLVEEPPYLARDGGFVKSGAHAPLDEMRSLRDESRRVIAGLEGKYRQQSAVSQLKIKHNGVLGYFIEVGQQHADKLIADKETFRHRQTMAGAVRFSTEELASLASRIAEAAESALAMEAALFNEMAMLALEHGEALSAIADALGVLDVTAALGELAIAARYVRPRMDNGLAFEITRGRHPVVEAALQSASAAHFVPNDCDLSPNAKGRLWLVTGPNMAGKSTFLRQNALIAILAQMGSFVPARSARIGVVDRLFSRVGAADDLARGRSTFMVEMVETAAILNQAGPQSFVILDEIGRGTATFDGLSIAWAALEHLHEVNRCRALFATHYHELTALAAKLPALACHTMRVKEWQGDVVFLHEVAPGTADRSYGIHVAKLAGLPAAVTARAEEVLQLLEQGEQGGALARLADDLPLFRAAVRRTAPEPAVDVSPVDALLREVRPDELTPREALELLYRLKSLLSR
jgi:DNA mismatch repair protein MutS